MFSLNLLVEKKNPDILTEKCEYFSSDMNIAVYVSEFSYNISLFRATEES